MLSIFPSALAYGFFAPTLLRLAAGISIVYMGTFMLQERTTLAHVRTIPVIGRVPQWLIWLTSIIYAIVGIALIAGFYTQVAAILGALISLKHAVGHPKYDEYLPLSLGANLLILAICLSLIVTGAGAIAFDLPL